MPNTEKKYFIYQDNQRIEVNMETYQVYYRPIWKTYKEKLRHGECGLHDWRKCKGDCGICSYRKEGIIVSDESLEFFSDSTQSVLAVIENKELILSLYASLNALEQYEQDICKLYMSGLSEREIASELDLPRSTFKYRWKKILEKLSENLKNFV